MGGLSFFDNKVSMYFCLIRLGFIGNGFGNSFVCLWSNVATIFASLSLIRSCKKRAFNPFEL